MDLELSTRAENFLQISEKFQLKNLCLSSRLKTFQNPKQKKLEDPFIEASFKRRFRKSNNTNQNY